MRTSTAAVVVGTLVGALIPGSALLAPVVPATAATAQAASLFAAVEPAKDRSGVLRLWKEGGPATTAAAEQALMADDASVKQFLDEGQYAAITQDYRTLAIQIALSGRTKTRETAQKAVASATREALEDFVTTQWQKAWIVDDREETTRLASSGLPVVKQAAAKALKVGTDAAIQSFIWDQREKADYTDVRMQVAKLLDKSELVAEGAQRVLDGDDEDALRTYLRYGQYVAAARDQEAQTVGQLVDQAQGSSAQALELSSKAQEMAAQAAQAAQLAKDAAERAAAEAAAAAGASNRAGAAASRAASLARQAATAAAQAINAAQEARAALGQAAQASANAASAAARAAQAAAVAQQAAANAATDASQAAAARAAAEGAREAARGAQAAADASDQAIRAVEQATSASSAAARAGQNAAAAASAAADAAEASGVSQQYAQQARDAAARAHGAADRAERAASSVESLAAQARRVAQEARQAALEARDHANRAAEAADEAAKQAGIAQTAAAKSTEYADASTRAANVATAAVENAQAVFELARTIEDDRLVAEREYLIAQAVDERAAQDERSAAALDGRRAAEVWAAKTQGLLTELSAPGVDAGSMVDTMRQAVLGLAITGAGAAERTMAERALVGSPETLKEFILSGLSAAREQDQWDRTVALVDHEDNRVSVAAQEALDGGEDVIDEFLTTQLRGLTVADERAAVAKLLDAEGPGVRKAAEAALNSPAPEAVADFLRTGLERAQLADDRQAATLMLADAGPELTVAIEVALAGTDASMKEFLARGQYDAVVRDHERSSHIASMEGLIAQGAEAAAKAREAAALGQQAAATARKAAADATRYATEARAHADAAKASADEADQYADQAQASADAAQASAVRAREAANQARADAAAAAGHAADAMASAQQAAASAQQAASAANAAAASATQAGKDAAAAEKAASEATSIAVEKKRAEDEKNRYTTVTAATAGDKPTDAELAAALASGGAAAVDALKKAYETLKKGDIWQMILKEGGQLLLDFIGVTDLMNCVTKGDIGSCAMLIASAFPIGKIAKLGSVLALLSKIAPKLVNHATDYARALETIAGAKGKAKTVPGVCTMSGAVFGPSSAPSIQTAGYRGTNSGTVQTAAATCKFPTPTGGNPGINPPKGKKTTPNDIGKYGEASMHSTIEKNPGDFGIGDLGNYNAGTRLYDSLKPNKKYPVMERRADGYYVNDGVIQVFESKNVSRLSGTRVAEQIEDGLLQVSKKGADGSKYTLFLRCDAAGAIITTMSAQISSLFDEYKNVVRTQCIR